MVFFLSKLADYIEDHLGQPSSLYKCDWPGCKETENLNETANSEDLNSQNEPKQYCSKHSYFCVGCGQYFKLRDWSYKDESGDHYCNNCFENLKTVCPKCHSEYLENELHEIKNGGRRYPSACEDCASQCENCLEWYLNANDDLHPIKIDDENVIYCDNCLDSLELTQCDKCENYFNSTDDGRIKKDIYGDSEGFLCENCGRVRCAKCNKIIEAKNVDRDATELANEWYHNDCYAEQFEAPEEFKKETGFALAKPGFNVAFSGWGHDLQRMYKNRKKNQLVLNITYDIGSLSENAKQVIGYINKLSEESGHPYNLRQIGWVRLELSEFKPIQNIKQLDLFEQPIAEEEKFMLIEEIQSDLDHVLYAVKSGQLDERYKKFLDLLTPDVFEELKKLTRKFPDLAMEAIFKFAKQYGYQTLYFHTYENKVKLQHTNPPKSLYTSLPKHYGFKPTMNAPFDLPGQYLSRKAKLKRILQLIKNASNDYLYAEVNNDSINDILEEGLFPTSYGPATFDEFGQSIDLEFLSADEYVELPEEDLIPRTYIKMHPFKTNNILLRFPKSIAGDIEKDSLNELYITQEINLDQIEYFDKDQEIWLPLKNYI